MRLIQLLSREGERQVGAIPAEGEPPHLVLEASSVRELALGAHRHGRGLAEEVLAYGLGAIVDYDLAIREQRMLLPLDHPDPAHLHMSITGLTHKLSAQARNSMHATGKGPSDSLRMFELGVEGGRPPAGEIGIQPEWAYKGNGWWTVPPGGALPVPPFGLDIGEEAELVGLYVIGDGGEVLRVGFALGNDLSDHVMERQNYLYLSHSKLRRASYGPELLLGALPDSVEGLARIVRDEKVIWEGSFATGEANMVHTISNLEHHHFKYEEFRAAGDVHVHFLGASAFSFSAGLKLADGDEIEIEAPLFGRALTNTLQAASVLSEPTKVIQL